MPWDSWPRSRRTRQIFTGTLRRRRLAAQARGRDTQPALIVDRAQPAAGADGGRSGTRRTVGQLPPSEQRGAGHGFPLGGNGSGGVPCDALMTDTKIYVETIMPEPICIPTQRNGTVAIYMGARFSTSDYGDGAVEMRTFLLNGVCLNGMVRESVMKQIHLGARLSESQMLSDRTYRLDTATMVSAIGDYTRNLYDPNNLRQKSLEIQAASEAEVDFEAELKKLVKGGRLQKTEGESVQKLLMANNPDDGLSGGATLWKLTQAITACARELAPARSRELQEISGELMARAL